MKGRILVAALVGATVAALAVACADEGETTASSLDSGPTGLPAADGSAARDGGLDTAIPPDPCLPGTLCPVPGLFAPDGKLDTRTRLTLVRGRAANDVWAMGAHGAALHFDGTAWQPSDLGSAEAISSLWLRDTGEVAMAGFQSFYAKDLAVAAVDGGAGPSDGGWTHIASPPHDDDVTQSTGVVTAAWSTPGAAWVWLTTQEEDDAFSTTYGLPSSINGLWRAGFTPATKTFSIESPLPDGTCDLSSCRQLNAIHGISGDDMWAVGFTGAAVHIQGAQSANPSVESYDSQTWAGLNGVWAVAADDVWAVGGNGTIRHYTGATHKLDIVDGIPTNETLHAVWGASPTDIWAVGDAATVLHYDGRAWSTFRVTGLGGRAPNLYSVWTMTPGQAWIVGDGILLAIGGGS